MPQAIVAVIAAIASAAVAASAATAIVQAVILVAIAVAAAAAQRALTPDIDKVSEAIFSTNGPTQEWQLKFGEFWSSGHVVYHSTTIKNEILNICEVYAPHEIEGGGGADGRLPIAWQFNQQQIIPDLKFLDANGYVIDGKYFTTTVNVNAGGVCNFRIEWDSGQDTYTQWPPFHAGPYDAMVDGKSVPFRMQEDLAQIPPEWNTSGAHGSGTAKGWYRGKQQPHLFRNGISDRMVFAKWNNQILDIRDSVTRYTSNPALILYHYLTLAKTLGGAGVPTTLIDSDSFETAANICDQEVEQTNGFTQDMDVAYPDSDEISLSKNDSERIWLQTGDGVELTNGGTLPSGLAISTRYYVILTRVKDGFDGASDSDWRIKLATSYANSLAGTAIDLTTAGGGGHTVTLKSFPRYTFAGSLSTKDRLKDNIRIILNSMGATLTPINGLAYLQAASYVAPTLSYNDSHLRGPIEFIQTKHPTASRFNAVRGEYISSSFYGVPQSYTAITNSTYETKDGGVRKYVDSGYPAVTRRNQAERLAKIRLEKHRQEIIIKLPMKLGDKTGGDSPFKMQKGDNIEFTNTLLGWTDKLFEVIEWKLVLGEGDQENAAIGVDVILQETASTVYDFAAGDETTEDPAPDTDLLSLIVKPPPTGLNVSEYRVDYADSAVIRVQLEWTKPTEGYISIFESQFKPAESSSATPDGWQSFPDVPYDDHETETVFSSYVNDLAPGKYDFRVRTKDALGKPSDWATITEKDIYGFNDPPSAPTNFSGTPAGDLIAIDWDQPTEDDVIYGGKMVIRHDSDVVTNSADWSDSVSIGSTRGEYAALRGSRMFLPLREGHYCGKYIDRFGQVGIDFASFFVKQNVSGYTAPGGTDSATESTTFTGTKTNCSVTGSTLTMDTVGGVSVEATARYEFATVLDLGSAKTCRVTPSIDVNVFLEYSNFDSRTDNIDDWLSFDDADGTEADARLSIRTTETDPTGSPTWTTWSLFDVGVFHFWGAQLRVDMVSDNSQANLDIIELSVAAESIP